MQKLPTKHTGSINELTPIIIKNIRQNPKFYDAANNIIKNICIGKYEYKEIKNNNNIKKLLEFYSQSINYQNNLSNKLQKKKQQLSQRVKQKKKHNEIKRENVCYERKQIKQKQEKINKNIKIVVKYKQQIKNNNRSNASMTHIQRNNSYNSSNNTTIWPNQFNDIRNMGNDYYMHQPASVKVPPKKERKCSCSQKIQQNGVPFGDGYSKNNRTDNKQIIPQDGYKIQQNIQMLPQDCLSNSIASQKFQNHMRRSIQQSKIAINTKGLRSIQQSNVQINIKEIQLTQMRNSSPINITTSLDDSFDKKNIIKPQKDQQIPTVKKAQKFQKLSYNYKDSFMQKNPKFPNQKTAKLCTPPRLQNNNSNCEQVDLSTQKEKRAESPIQIDNAFDQLQEQSVIKKISGLRPKKLVGNRISNPTIDSRIAFKNDLKKKLNYPPQPLEQSLQLTQSLTTSLKDFRENERATNLVKFNSNNYIQEQSDKSEDLRSTVNDNNIRKKMIELMEKYQLTLTTKQNLSVIKKEIQEQYNVSKGWKQQLEFWRGIVQKFGGDGKKAMKILIADLSESLAIRNSGIGSRVNDLRNSQTGNSTKMKQRRLTQDRISSSQKGNE